MQFYNLIFILTTLFLSNVVNSIPIPVPVAIPAAMPAPNAEPKVITRYHVAPTSTVTINTVIMVTTTIPVVEVLISNGVTYTNTLFTVTTCENNKGVSPITQTSITNDPATATPPPAAAATTPPAQANTTVNEVVETTATTDAAGVPAEAETTPAPQVATTTTTTPDAAQNAATTATAPAPAQNQNTTSTPQAEQQATATSTTPNAAAPPPATTTTTNAVQTTVQTTVQKGTQPTTVQTTSSTSAAAQSTGSVNGVPAGIVYSPYTNSGGCKDYDTVKSDLDLINSKGIGMIRVYGNDCNYLTTVLPIAQSLGLKVNQGFWIDASGVDSIDNAVTEFINAVQGGSNGYSWDLFKYITVGNEAIISGYCTVSELISKISQVKGQLKSAGFTGLVTTSEPPVIFENNSELCQNSEIDFVGINSHSYFDPNSAADTTGSFLAGQIKLTQGYCPNLNVVLTETGYPSAGEQYGSNIPSAANQKIAIGQILELDIETTILSTFNDYWKNPGPYGIEQSFGVIEILN
ncbi:hypothetical protein BVG19_g4783 [[Candida] boidinii]|nr:hypothetical protein BVG19_g4783 [[Candida] boidinii]OWB52691.1 hypothetical protein B5S27_g4272 [[Candida] boidinii]OWB67972.1 hypothetical protein B5S30_g3342 [[Candida] boidinii]